MKISRSTKRRAVAGIIAGVILFALLFTAGVTFFIFWTNLNHQNDQALEAAQAANLGRSLESLSLVSQVGTDTKLQAVVMNTGGNSTTLIALFLEDQNGKMLLFCSSTGTSSPCAAQPFVAPGPTPIVFPPSWTLNVGNTVTLDTGILASDSRLANCQQGATPTPCSIGVITKLGRVLTTQFPEPTPPTSFCNPSLNNCPASVASGLGSLSINFDSYYWYSSGACAPQGSSPYAVIGQNPKSSCLLVGGLGPGNFLTPPRAYQISQSGMTNAGTNLWFGIQVTNDDPQGRTIIIDQFTQLWFSWFCPQVIGSNGPCAPGPHGQQTTSYYGMVLVCTTGSSICTVANGCTAVGTSCTATPTITLTGPTGPNNSIPGQTATIYFGLQESDSGAFPGIPLCGFGGKVPFSSQITPVFLFFHGTVGGLPWGQDFPLASTLWTDIGGSC